MGILNYFPFDHVHRFFDYSNLIFPLTSDVIVKHPDLRLAPHFSFAQQSIASFGRIPRLSSSSTPLGQGEAEVLQRGIACS